MLSVTFATLWILPFYLLSKVVNSIWFADIADSAFRKTANGRPRMMNSFSVSIADTVFTIVVEIIFLIQAKLFSICVPINAISKLINVFHLCLLNALYCFEYKWYNQGLELHKRLSFIESNWPYFLGENFFFCKTKILREIIFFCSFRVWPSFGLNHKLSR